MLIQEDETLRTVMEGDNSDSNKRDVFNRTFESLLVELVGENIDFYNKLSDETYLKQRCLRLQHPQRQC